VKTEKILKNKEQSYGTKKLSNDGTVDRNFYGRRNYDFRVGGKRRKRFFHDGLSDKEKQK
jgi:hypothetical protein